MKIDIATVHQASNDDAIAQAAFTSEGGRQDPRMSERQDDQERLRNLMTELGIRDAGATYRFRGYRYDRLEDAVAYAQLVRSREAQGLAEDRDAPTRALDDDPGPPDRSERTVMAPLNVTYERGRYRFGGYAYSAMADALAYARKARGL